MEQGTNSLGLTCQNVPQKRGFVRRKLGDLPFCDEGTRLDSPKLPWGLSQRRPLRSERDWEDEKRTVLGRLFDAAFGRREATEEELGSDIH
jgi:hypothetical protein